MHFALAALAGATLGMLSGGLAAFAWSVLSLTSIRLANRGRMARGEPPTKNQVRVRMELPGLVVGALGAGAYSGAYGLRVPRALAVGALSWGAALVVIYAVALAMLAVETLRDRQRKST